MRSIGIIGEFNPFHEGHKYLIETSVKELRADVVVSAISGSFTQRGEPAFLDKWTRARICIENGIDLVVEIPQVYACNSAEMFARGGVSVLEGFGQISHLVFGSESGDIRQLVGIASVIKKNYPAITEETGDLLKKGYSFPKARAAVLRRLTEHVEDGLLEGSNNILALEYINHLEHMTPFTIERKGESHLLSSTNERERIIQEDPEKYSKRENTFFDLIRGQAILKSSEELENTYQAGEGLGNKLKNEVRMARSRDDLVDRIKSKAYTRTRITRFLTQALIGITNEAVACTSPYIRVLGFNEKGAAFMRKCISEESPTVPIITNINKAKDLPDPVRASLSLDIRATDIYNIITDADMYLESDYVKKPYIGIE